VIPVVSNPATQRVVAVLLAVVTAACGSGASKHSEARPVSYQVVQDDRLGFSFECPAGWRLDVRDGTTVVLSEPGDGTRRVRVVLQVTRRPRRGGSRLGERVLQAQADLAARGATITRIDSIRVAGRPAGFFTALYAVRSQGPVPVTIHHVQIVFASDSREYWLTFQGPARTFRSHKDDLRRVLDTFRL
jgi:hypothetical protein